MMNSHFLDRQSEMQNRDGYMIDAGNGSREYDPLGRTPYQGRTFPSVTNERLLLIENVHTGQRITLKFPGDMRMWRIVDTIASRVGISNENLGFAVRGQPITLYTSTTVDDLLGNIISDPLQVYNKDTMYILKRVSKSQYVLHY